MSLNHILLPKVTEAIFRIRDVILPNGTDWAPITFTSGRKSQLSKYWTIELSSSSRDFVPGNITVAVALDDDKDCDPLLQNVYPSLYTSMHLVPLADVNKTVSVSGPHFKLSQRGYAIGLISRTSIMSSADKASFDIVLSTEDTMAQKSLNTPIPLTTPPPLPPPVKNQDILPFLLSDPHSVDVCFVFPNESKYSGYGLWAHRLVLSRNEVFAKMVDDAVRQAIKSSASKALYAPVTSSSASSNSTAAITSTSHQPQAADGQSYSRGEQSIQDGDISSCSSFVDIDNQYDSASEAEMITPKVKAPATTATGSGAGVGLNAVPVYSTTTSFSSTSTTTTDTERTGSTLTLVIMNHSLATFCSLLRFVYTGMVDNSNRFSDFVFSVSNAPASILGPIPPPLSQSRDSTSIRWTILPDENDVWTIAKEEDLMLCAHEFGIDDLAASCQSKLEKLISEANIGHILFDIVPVYPKIKDHAMEYVVMKKAELFAPGKDMFEKFRGYTQCHSVMMEIFQLMALSK